jgi:hypothetical protein
MRTIVIFLIPGVSLATTAAGLASTAEFGSQHQRFGRATKLSDFPLTSACTGVSVAAEYGSREVVMPERANSLESAFVAGTLAAAALLGLNMTPSSAAECLENPEPTTAEPGHWHYRTDRARNRRCYFFVPAKVPGPQIAPPPAMSGAPDRRDQPEQNAGNEKQESPLNEADRKALIQDFVKWQLDRTLFGRP